MYRRVHISDRVRAPSCSPTTSAWVSSSIRTENAVQQSRRKTLKFCNGLPVIGSAGLSLLQKSAAEVRTFAISFATERSHNPVCDHGIEQVSSYHPNPKCIFCSDAPRTPSTWTKRTFTRTPTSAVARLQPRLPSPHQLDGANASD